MWGWREVRNSQRFSNSNNTPTFKAISKSDGDSATIIIHANSISHTHAKHTKILVYVFLTKCGTHMNLFNCLRAVVTSNSLRIYSLYLSSGGSHSGASLLYYTRFWQYNSCTAIKNKGGFCVLSDHPLTHSLDFVYVAQRGVFPSQRPDPVIGH